MKNSFPRGAAHEVRVGGAKFATLLLRPTLLNPLIRENDKTLSKPRAQLVFVNFLIMVDN